MGNLHLLFWLSLVPFVTAWMSENHFPEIPTAVYGIVLLAAAVAYYVLQWTLLWGGRRDPCWPGRSGATSRGKVSPALYCIGIALSFADRWLGLAVYVVIALMWLIPDRGVEHAITGRQQSAGDSGR